MHTITKLHKSSAKHRKFQIRPAAGFLLLGGDLDGWLKSFVLQIALVLLKAQHMN